MVGTVGKIASSWLPRRLFYGFMSPITLSGRHFASPRSAPCYTHVFIGLNVSNLVRKRPMCVVDETAPSYFILHFIICCRKGIELFLLSKIQNRKQTRETKQQQTLAEFCIGFSWRTQMSEYYNAERAAWCAGVCLFQLGECRAEQLAVDAKAFIAFNNDVSV